MPNKLSLPHGDLQLPTYLPDATKGVVRSLDSSDLDRTGIPALVMNAFHLMQNPGSSTIKALGGIHAMSGWRKPIITDSGGFQIYSLIRQNSKYGSISDKGAQFRTDASNRKYKLTPEKSIQLQMSYGTDIAICLDDCTHVDNTDAEQQKSVERTIAWAKRCKDEYLRLIDEQNLEDEQRPLIFGVIQGGGNKALRQQCIDELLNIGFDGFGYGGWPLDADGNLLEDTLGYVREYTPRNYALHALGIGHPPSIQRCTELGYEIFDSAMPTRDARNGRLYYFSDDLPEHARGEHWFQYLYPTDAKHIKSTISICIYNDETLADRYSVGYLNHLFAIGDSSAQRLATLHNLGFMTRFMAKIQKQLASTPPD